MIQNYTVNITAASGTASPAATASPTASPAATASATASVSSAATATTAGGSSVHISLKIANFQLVAPSATASASPAATATVAQNSGHIAYSLQPEGSTSFQTPVQMASTDYTWTNLPAGVHTYRAELVNASNNPLATPVYVQFMIRIPAASALASPMIKSYTVDVTAATGTASASASSAATASAAASASPAATTTAAGGSSVKLTLNLANFQLVTPTASASASASPAASAAASPAASASASASPASTATAAQNSGHIAYSLMPAGSTSFQTAVQRADTTYTWSNLPVGVHTYRAELVNASNNPLATPVYVQFMITLPGVGQATSAATASPSPTVTASPVTTP